MVSETACPEQVAPRGEIANGLAKLFCAMVQAYAGPAMTIGMISASAPNKMTGECPGTGRKRSTPAFTHITQSGVAARSKTYA